MGPTAQFSLPKFYFHFSLFGYFFVFVFFLNHSKWSGENRYMCSLKQQQTSVSHFSCLYCKENIVSVTGSHKSHTRALRERREVSEKRRPRHVHNLRYFEYPKTSRSFSTTDFSVPLRAASEVGMMTFSEEGLDTESSLELGRKVRRQI